MIDLHNHILPGIDDGALNLAESVEIARHFVCEGVTEIAATPHLDPVHGRGASPEVVRARLTEVQQALETEHVPLRLCSGQELFLTPEADELLSTGAALPLGDSRYVLVEVSMVAVERPAYLDDALFRLQLAGYRPILAHPERYPFVQRDPRTATELATRGVALQLTAPSLLGEYGARVRRTARYLLGAGAYALAGSDRHHPGRSRSLADLAARLQRECGAGLAELLLTANPRRVLDGKSLLSPELLPERRSLPFVRLFQR